MLLSFSLFVFHLLSSQGWVRFLRWESFIRRSFFLTVRFVFGKFVLEDAFGMDWKRRGFFPCRVDTLCFGTRDQGMWVWAYVVKKECIELACVAVSLAWTLSCSLCASFIIWSQACFCAVGFFMMRAKGISTRCLSLCRREIAVSSSWSRWAE